MQSGKQLLQVTGTFMVLNGNTWVTMYEGMIQPVGEPFYAVEAVHMSGSRMGWRFIGEEERNRLLKETESQINH